MRLRAPAVLVALLLLVPAAVGVLRIVSGHHCPSDVLAGAAIGAGCGPRVPLPHRER